MFFFYLNICCIQGSNATNFAFSRIKIGKENEPKEISKESPKRHRVSNELYTLLYTVFISQANELLFYHYILSFFRLKV